MLIFLDGYRFYVTNVNVFTKLLSNNARYASVTKWLLVLALHDYSLEQQLVSDASRLLQSLPPFKMASSERVSRPQLKLQHSHTGWSSTRQKLRVFKI